MPDMPDTAHPAGNLHLLAALDHEATARLHREAAARHAQSRRDEAGASAMSALEQCQQANMRTVSACKASTREPESPETEYGTVR